MGELIEEAGEKDRPSIAFLINIFNPELLAASSAENMAYAGATYLMLLRIRHTNKYSLSILSQGYEISAVAYGRRCRRPQRSHAHKEPGNGIVSHERKKHSQETDSIGLRGPLSGGYRRALQVGERHAHLED